MPENCENCKANPVDIARKTLGTPTAKLIAILQAQGITDSKELAEIIGVGVRAVQLAKQVSQRSILREAGFAKTKQVSPSEAGFAKQDSSLARANKESLRDSSYQEVKIIPLTPKAEPTDRVRLSAGTIELCSDLRKFWLTEFDGDERRLRLALVEVGGRVQVNSSRPLEAQVSSQLARIVADKADKDRRYTAAVVANQAAKPAAKPFKPSRWGC